MDREFLKITYNLGSSKMSAYLRQHSPVFSVLKDEIEKSLFEEHKQPRCEIRIYWIDEDQDEIEIFNQYHFDVFVAKCYEHKHLQVAPKISKTDESKTSENSTASSTNQDKIPPAAGSYDFAVHDRVECDACLMAPIIGFRYKCIQCPNYDLCQNCESKHLHSEHMMVRMPTNNCPSVIEAYVTGRNPGRRHGKRSKTSCPVVASGLSVLLDDEEQTANAAGGESGEQSSPANGKERHHGRRHHRRHQRNNFLSHLYEMMHDLAEGGGAAAAAHATGEDDTMAAASSKTTTTTTGPHTTTTTKTTTTSGSENIENNAATAAAASVAAHIAAQQAHETAVNAAEIAAKTAHETAAEVAEITAKVAHEKAAEAAKNFTNNLFASGGFPLAADSGQQKETAKEKADATTTTPNNYQTQPNEIPLLASPSLETFTQFLDPQYMKTGIQILNNFSDMFAKMLDPMENNLGPKAATPFCPFNTNSRMNSTTSSKSSVASNLNSMGNDEKSEKDKSEKEKSMENKENKSTQQQSESSASSHVDIEDLGSDSENDSVSESFIKLDAPKEANKDSNNSTPSSAKSVTAATSAQTTPPQSLNKSNVMDFAQLSANLKAHIAEEAEKNSTAKANDSVVNDQVDNAATVITSTTTANEPVVTTTSSTTTTASTNNSQFNKSEENRAVPVYHPDQRINNSILAMMSMGFSNEGGTLTHLLESVNGNIPEALDLMSVSQRAGSR